MRWNCPTKAKACLKQIILVDIHFNASGYLLSSIKDQDCVYEVQHRKYDSTPSKCQAICSICFILVAIERQELPSSCTSDFALYTHTTSLDVKESESPMKYLRFLSAACEQSNRAFLTGALWPLPGGFHITHVAMDIKSIPAMLQM